MRDVRVQEINDQGEALEWEGDLFSIAEELLVEHEHPKIESILSILRHPERHWPVTHTPVAWFCRQMNDLSNGYTYDGWMVSEVVTHCPDCGIDVRRDVHGFRLLHSLFCSLTDAECRRLSKAADAAGLQRGWKD